VRDAEPDLQLQGDAVLAIVGVIAGDPPDELDVLAFDAWPSRCRLASPVVPEPLLLPPDHSVGLHDDERGPPVLPDAGEERPEQSVSVSKGWPWSLPLEHDELLAENEFAHQQCSPRPDEDEGVEHLNGNDDQ